MMLLVREKYRIFFSYSPTPRSAGDILSTLAKNNSHSPKQKVVVKCVKDKTCGHARISMLRSLRKKGGSSVVTGMPQVYHSYTALLYELAFTAMRSVSGYCCKLRSIELG